MEVLRELDRLVHHALRFFGIAHLNITGERKVLALRMTLEPIVRQDTAQVAVAGADYAIHVIDFAFPTASHRPDVSDDRHRLIYVRRDIDTTAVVLGRAKLMVADFEPFRTIGELTARPLPGLT